MASLSEAANGQGEAQAWVSYSLRASYSSVWPVVPTVWHPARGTGRGALVVPVSSLCAVPQWEQCPLQMSCSFLHDTCEGGAVWAAGERYLLCLLRAEAVGLCCVLAWQQLLLS